MIAWDDSPSPKRHLEPQHVGREVRDRDDPQDVALAVPQQDVAAVGAEERRRVVDDRREDGVEVERLGDTPGGDQELVELIAQGVAWRGRSSARSNLRVAARCVAVRTIADYGRDGLWLSLTRAAFQWLTPYGRPPRCYGARHFHRTRRDP